MARKSNSTGVSAVIPSGPSISRNRLMPGLRVRHDGWTEERTQRYFDALAHTGCVRDAARVAGVSTASAYRMKGRFVLFSDAWERALSRAGQGLMAVAYKRAVDGKETVIIRGGQEVERRITPSDAILGLLLKRGDLTGGGLMDGKTSEEYLSFEEWQQHKRFDERGRKVEIEDPEVSAVKFVDKMQQMRGRLVQRVTDGDTCPICKQAFPEGWPSQSMAELVAAGLVDYKELFAD